jgi:hypothetical protein
VRITFGAIQNKTSMSDNISRESALQYIQQVNQAFKVDLNPEDFKSAGYSVSSLQDILIQKTVDELNGEWTSDMAFHKIKSAMVRANGKEAKSITLETALVDLFPASSRRAEMKKLSDELGFPLEVLKPNSALYGTFIFLFFACIPFGIGMDWFFSGIVMVVCAVAIFIMGKTGNHFRMKTVGQMADDLAWKNYLKKKRTLEPVNTDDIRKKVEAMVK